MMMTASGMRMTAERIVRSMGRASRCVRLQTAPNADRSAAVEALAHLLAGLEERHALLVDRDMRAGARIAAGTRRPVLDRERAEAAQLDTVTARERTDDLVEN